MLKVVFVPISGIVTLKGEPSSRVSEILMVARLEEILKNKKVVRMLPPTN